MWINGTQRTDRLADWQAVDMRRVERDHLAEPAVMHQPHGMRAKLSRQHTVERRWRPAPLQVAQHDAATFAMQSCFDLRGDQRSDAAQAGLSLIGQGRL